MCFRILIHWKKIPWVLLAFALCIRSSAVFLGLEDLRDDPDAYRRLAINWAKSGVLGIESQDGPSVRPSAFRPPLFPWLLSWLVEDSRLPPVRVAVLQLLLGIATVWLAWSIAGRLGLTWPWLPAALLTVDPLLLRASQLVMTETLAGFLTLLAWWLWLRVYSNTQACSIEAKRLATKHGDERSMGQWLSLVGLGLVLGLSILARPTAAPWLALVCVGMLFVGCQCWKRRVNDMVVVVALAASCVAPWTLRNLAELGQPIWATSHGGYTLLLANNPLVYQHFSQHGPTRNWDAEPFHARWAQRQQTTISPAERSFWFATDLPPAAELALGEIADDELAYEAAWSTISRQPAMFAASCLYRLGWLWAPWPNTGSMVSRLAIGCWYSAVFAMAIVGLGMALGQRRMRSRAWRLREWRLREWLLPIALILSLSAVHAIYWSNMRMRAPLMAAVYMAGCGLSVKKPPF